MTSKFLPRSMFNTHITRIRYRQPSHNAHHSKLNLISGSNCLYNTPANTNLVNKYRSFSMFQCPLNRRRYLWGLSVVSGTLIGLTFIHFQKDSKLYAAESQSFSTNESLSSFVNDTDAYSDINLSKENLQELYEQIINNQLNQIRHNSKYTAYSHQTAKKRFQEYSHNYKLGSDMSILTEILSPGIQLLVKSVPKHFRIGLQICVNGLFAYSAYYCKIQSEYCQDKINRHHIISSKWMELFERSTAFQSELFQAYSTVHINRQEVYNRISTLIETKILLDKEIDSTYPDIDWQAARKDLNNNWESQDQAEVHKKLTELRSNTQERNLT